MNSEIYSVTCHNGRFALSDKYGMFSSNCHVARYKLKVVKECYDEDTKTDIIQNKGCIPINTEIESFEVIRNFYGMFFGVMYNDKYYSINPKFIDIISKENIV